MFNRYELIGIGVSILVVGGVLAIVRYGGPVGVVREEGAQEREDVIVVDSALADADMALAQALLAGSDSRGRIRALIVQEGVIGSGREVRAGDTVTVHYVADVRGGTQFGNTRASGEPFVFQVGSGEVIEGLERGVIGMKEGGTRTLIVPASMGYGNRSVGPVPANATLIFFVELLSLK